MASETAPADDEGTAHLIELVRGLARSGQSFSITLDDTTGLSGKRGGDRTRRFLSLVGEAVCKKWVYQPGTGLVCVDPPS